MEREVWKPGNMLYPLPVVMVTCQNPGEKPNIITIAWAGTICSDPAMLSISVRKERYSYNIIKNTKEFVVNLVGAEQTKAMDYCGVKSGRDVDKFAETGLTPIESATVAVPSIKECPVSIECKVERVIELGSHDMFIAKVTAVTVNGQMLNEKGSLNLEKANLITYSHGSYYVTGKKVGTFGYSVKKKTKKKTKRKS